MTNHGVEIQHVVSDDNFWLRVSGGSLQLPRFPFRPALTGHDALHALTSPDDIDTVFNNRILMLLPINPASMNLFTNQKPQL